MLWPSEARSRTAPPTQSEAKSQLYLAQLLLRRFPQVGVNRTPEGIDQRIGIHGEHSDFLFLKFQRSINSQAHCAHGRTALRLPGAKGSGEMKYPDRTAPNLCNANIRRWHSCASHSMGDVVSGMTGAPRATPTLRMLTAQVAISI